MILPAETTPERVLADYVKVLPDTELAGHSRMFNGRPYQVAVRRASTRPYSSSQRMLLAATELERPNYGSIHDVTGRGEVV